MVPRHGLERLVNRHGDGSVAHKTASERDIEGASEGAGPGPGRAGKAAARRSRIPWAQLLGGAGCLAVGAALTSPSPALLAQFALSAGCIHVRIFAFGIAFAFAFLPSPLPQTRPYASSHPTCGLSNAVETRATTVRLPLAALRSPPSLRPESPSSPAPAPRNRQGDVHYHRCPSSSHCCVLSNSNRLACSPPNRRPSRHQLLQEPTPALCHPARRST